MSIREFIIPLMRNEQRCYIYSCHHLTHTPPSNSNVLNPFSWDGKQSTLNATMPQNFEIL